MPGQLFQLRMALRGNQVDTNLFIMAREGMIPLEEFFNPAKLAAVSGENMRLCLIKLMESAD
jgi:hypothetical protein